MANLRRLQTLTAVLALSGWLGPDLNAADWPQWRGPDRNGIVPVKLPTGDDLPLHTLWETSVGTGFASIVVVENRLITVGNVDEHDIIQCLDAKTGNPLWQHRFPEPLDPNLFEGGPTATPLVVDDTVYSISRQGKIFALNLESGLVQWEVDVVKEFEVNVPTWGFAGSPLCVGETLIFNVGSNGLCLDRKTGETLWESGNDEDAGYTSPVLYKSKSKTVCLIVSGKTFNIVDPVNGKVLASERWITRYGINAADPLIIDDEHLLLSSGYGKGTALFRFDGEELTQLWRNRDLRIQMSPGVLIDGTVFGVDGDANDENSLVCLNPLTGEVHWRHELSGPGSLLATENAIGLLEANGTWTQFRPQTSQFESLGTAEINTSKCWTPPILADGCLYSRNAAGRIVCSGVQAGSVSF